MTESRWRRCPNCEGAGVVMAVVEPRAGEPYYAPPEACPACVGTGGFRITIDCSRSVLVAVAPAHGRR